MKNNKILRVLGIAIVLSLLVVAIPATPALAAGYIYVSPDDGEIDDSINIYGYGFTPGATVYIYFSSDEAEEGDHLDEEVTAYELVVITTAGAAGAYNEGEIDIYFTVPDELTDGDDDEDVHGGDYYIYVTTHSTSKKIMAVADFTVIGGELTRP